jgi:hypothetical protein
VRPLTGRRPSPLAVLLAAYWALAAGAPAPRVAVAELLRLLSASGVSVLYSSDLVPPTLTVPASARAGTLLSQVEAALAAHNLQLSRTDDHHYVVTRAAPAHGPAATAGAGPAQTTGGPAAAEEVVVFASHYAIENDAGGEPHALDQRAIEQVPGTQNDALRAVRSAPGVASTFSARPYIRGGTADEVLFRFDEVTLTNPYHFHAFESLLSPFLPADVDRIDIYSGGYPVRFGTSTAGVIDVAPRTVSQGYELGADASRLGVDLSGAGRLEQWPVEWLASIRRSPDETSVLQPIDANPIEPVFFDALTRARWIVSPDASVTLGWMLLDDQARASEGSRDELATARSYDEYAWLAWDWAPVPALQSHTSLAYTQSQNSHSGNLELTGLANGSLDEYHDFSSYAARTEWTYLSRAGLLWNAGAELTVESAALHYHQNEAFTNSLGPGFVLQPLVSVDSNQSPHSSTFGLFASARRQWQAFEAEIGARLDGQDYRGFGARTQLTPRLNGRYDLAPDWHAYASWGEFSQAQRVDEYRSAENQSLPDPANRAVHAVLGLAHEPADALRWRVEIYRNHWSSVSPYYDNALGLVTLLPELQPDRIRLAPLSAESDGVELSARQTLGRQLTLWSTYTLAQVLNELPAGEVPRSWDQRQAANLGLAWKGPRTTASFLLGWHSGWPRTALSLLTASPGGAPDLQLGPYNALRWGSYLSLDAYLSRSLFTRLGELAVWLEVSDATNRGNDCCAELSPVTGATPSWSADSWPGRSVTLGFSWRLQGGRGPSPGPPPRHDPALRGD